MTNPGDEELFDQPSTRAAALLARPIRQTSPRTIRDGFQLHGKWTWEVTKRLGRGGYGAVYAVSRLGPQDAQTPPDEAAVKVFTAPEGMDPALLLKRELAALLALKSRYIPKVYDWSVTNNLCFVVMELFPRGSLVDVSDTRSRLKPAVAWRLLMNLLEALIIAHQTSLLHLDVKPSNVLIGEDGRFVLTDFGVAQSTFASRTTGISGRGTPGYRAPEQLAENSDEVDVRTDLFGVGATVWSRLAGVELTRHPELVNLDLDGGHTHALPPPSTYNRHCPANLDQAVMNMLHIDPVDRPGGAAEALTLTRRLLSGHSAGMTLPTDARGMVPETLAEEVTSALIDPLWLSIAGGPGAWQFLMRFPKGRFLCREGERSHHAFALLRGSVAIERGGERLFLESREGTFLGEVHLGTKTKIGQV